MLTGLIVYFYKNNHQFSNQNKAIYEQGYADSKKDDCINLRSSWWVGAGVILLQGVSGKNAIAYAVIVVTKSVQSLWEFSAI